MTTKLPDRIRLEINLQAHIFKVPLITYQLQ